MSHHPEPISFWNAVDKLPEEPKNLEPARDTILEMGGDTNCSVWKRLEAAVSELNDARDEAIHLMEELHDQLEGMRYDDC
jgi:hypothetical protein